MIAWISAALILAGAGFVLIAAIGVLRLPDVLSRIHAATKAGAFGASLLLGGAVLHLGAEGVLLKAVLAIAFFYLTAPVAGHLLGRAAYRRHRTELNLQVDEWWANDATTNQTLAGETSSNLR